MAWRRLIGEPCHSAAGRAGPKLLAPSPPTIRERTMTTHAIDVAQGKRLQFGKSWERFLKVLNEGRISTATIALAPMPDSDARLAS